MLSLRFALSGILHRLSRLHCRLTSRRRPRLMRGHGCTALCRRIVLCCAIPPPSKSPATWLMLLFPPALVVDPILSENRRKRSTLAPIVSNAWLSGFALHSGNFLKPLSYSSHASHTSHFVICKARSTMPRTALQPAKREAHFPYAASTIGLAVHFQLALRMSMPFSVATPLR